MISQKSGRETDTDGCRCIWANVYLLACAFGVKPRRRQPTREGDIRKIFIDLRGRENKRSFWELASYDDLSARFNGVSSIAVTMLAVDARSLFYVPVFLRTRSPVCTSLYARTNLWPFPILFLSSSGKAYTESHTKEISIFMTSDKLFCRRYLIFKNNCLH